MAHRRAKKHEDLTNYRTPYQMLGPFKLIIALFWQLDVISIILIVAALGCLLVPFTLTNSYAQGWNQIHIYVPLIFGFLLFPVFFFWQTKSPHPMLPFARKFQPSWIPVTFANILQSSGIVQCGVLCAWHSSSTSPGTCRVTTSTQSPSSHSTNP